MKCKIRCKRCERLVPCTAKLPLLCGCGRRHFDQSELEQVDAPPNLPKLVMTATTAYAKWVQAGRPMRTAAEVEKIHAICQACPLFKGDHCGLCLCPVSGEVSIRNKAALATEHCPLSEPKW